METYIGEEHNTQKQQDFYRYQKDEKLYIMKYQVQYLKY